MSIALNAAQLLGEIGVGGLILNDYTLKISEIEGGHRLTVTRGSEVQTLDVMGGTGGSGDELLTMIEEVL